MKPQTVLVFLMAWKIPSTAAQLYMAALIASAGSSAEPFLNLILIAHMGATIATLRGIDALIDMTMGRLVHGHSEAADRASAAESAPVAVTVQTTP